jgi:hypothetical protein
MLCSFRKQIITRLSFVPALYNHFTIRSPCVIMCDIPEQFHFLRLPAELRLRVYHLVIAPVRILPDSSLTYNRAFYPGSIIWHDDHLPIVPSITTKTICDTQQTNILPSASTLRCHSGLLLSCRQIYTEVEAELLKRYGRFIDRIKAQWPTNRLPLDLCLPKCLRDTNHLSIGIPYNSVTTDGAYYKHNISNRHTCFCTSSPYIETKLRIKAPTLEASSHVKALIPLLLNYLPSFSLRVAYMVAPIIERHLYKCVKYRLMVGMSEALEEALVAKDPRLHRPDPRLLGSRLRARQLNNGTVVSESIHFGSSRSMDTLEYCVRI